MITYIATCSKASGTDELKSNQSGSHHGSHQQNLKYRVNKRGFKEFKAWYSMLEVFNIRFAKLKAGKDEQTQN